MATTDGRPAFFPLMCGEAVSDAPGDCRRNGQHEPDADEDDEQHYGVHGDLRPIAPAVRPVAS